MNLVRGLRWLLVLAILFCVGSVVWAKLISHGYIQINPGTNSASFTLTDGKTSKVAATGSRSGRYNLPTGDYVLSFQQGSVTNSLELVHIGPFSWLNKTTADSTKPSLGPKLVLNKSPLSWAPLDGGYIYLQSSDRSIHVIDTNGTDSDVSSDFGLAASSDATNTDAVYSSALSIQAIQNTEAVVTTTQGVYVIKNKAAITRLTAISGADGLLASAYDSSAKQLYVLTTDANTVYRYNSVDTPAVPVSVFKTQKIVNRLSAGGGRLVTYYDDAPNTDPALLKVLAEKKQLSPVLIDVDKKTSITLDRPAGAVIATLSPSGQYVLLKDRFASVMDVADTTTGKNLGTVPAFDINGVAWLNTTLYFGRGNAVWGYDVTQDKLTKISDLGIGTSDVQVYGGVLFASTAGGQLVSFVAGSTGFTPASALIQHVIGSDKLYQYYRAGE